MRQMQVQNRRFGADRAETAGNGDSPHDIWRRAVAFGILAMAVAFQTAGLAQSGPNPRNTRPSGSIAVTDVDQGAVISNGTVQLGINPAGQLNVPGPDSAQFTPYVGLRYLPTNNEATAPGCLCEGWGVGDLITDISGWANEDEFPNVNNLVVDSFVAGASTATSTVYVVPGASSGGGGGDIFAAAVPAGAIMRVTHNYAPSAHPNLYRVTVTIENITSQAQHIVYRRVMDWDIEPTPFEEYVTLQKGTSPVLVGTTNDGFDTANPLSPQSSMGQTGSFVDAGPSDHGANFQFDFGTLPPGQSIQFFTYYGAAATEAEAFAALGAVGVEAYSFGQASVADGPTLGVPNTFIFAFSGVGGGGVLPPSLAELVANHGGPGPLRVLALGSGFKPGAEFVLHCGPADLTAANVVVASDGFSLEGDFNFAGAPLGPCDAEITNPADPTPATLNGAFDVQALDPAAIQVELSGPAFIGANRYAFYTLAITNVGNVNASSVHACIRQIPAEAFLNILTPGAYLSPESSATEAVVCIDFATLAGGITRYLNIGLVQPFTRSINMRGTSSAPLFDEDFLLIAVVASFDPNAKSGPSGNGAEHYITGADPLTYLIQFENDADATAPVQELVVTDRLDPSKVDLSTFSFGPISIGRPAGSGGGVLTYAPLPGVSAITTTADYAIVDGPGDPDSDPDDIIVRIEATLNTTSGDPDEGLVTWTLTAIDPLTGQLPVNPLRGFLFPNNAAPEGDGSVSFTVSARSGIASGTEITNSATIVFDANTPIVTPAWSNLVDFLAPSSAVNELPPTTTSTTFNVSWLGTDPTGAIDHYDIFVRTNGGAWTPFLSNQTGTTAPFTGSVGNTYAFYSVATDLAGNVEAPPAAADATTTIVSLCASNVSEQVTVTRGAFVLNRATNRFQQTVTLRNNGAAIGGPVSLALDGLSANASLFNQNGATACTSPAGSPYVNVNVGGDNILSTGETVTVLLDFANPTKAAIAYSTRVLGAGSY